MGGVSPRDPVTRGWLHRIAARTDSMATLGSCGPCGPDRALGRLGSFRLRPESGGPDALVSDAGHSNPVRSLRFVPWYFFLTEMERIASSNPLDTTLSSPQHHARCHRPAAVGARHRFVRDHRA